MKKLHDFDLKGKRVLLRADINSDVSNAKVLVSERIKESAKTINYLIKKKAKVVVLAHQGSKGKRDFVGLREHVRFLNKYVKIDFVDDIVGEKAIGKINKLKDGEALLLDNVRFVDDEFNPEKKNNKLIKRLSPLFDLYVNDAFSVCHRNQTSIVGFPRCLKSCAGLLLEKEIDALKSVSIKDAVYILGGAKPEDNLKLFKGGKKILAGGIFGQLCVIASGVNLGENNEKENRSICKNYDLVLGEIKKQIKKVRPVLPVDYAVEVRKKRKEFNLKDFPTDYIVYDIGEKTQERFINEIKKAKAVYMKGPLGFFNNKEFSNGTFRILRAISESKAFSLLGGGHLSDAIKASKISKNKFNHISLSGGALLNYIAGKKLPGIEALG